jgi:DNA-binding response OmpR family regulator
MRVLVVDANRAFARKVRDAILRYGRENEIEVDVAHNVPVLQLRLAEHRYDFIMADVMTAIDPDELIEVLENTDAIKFVWTMTPNLADFKTKVADLMGGQVLTKPTNGDVEDAVSCVMASVSGQHYAVK